MLQAHPVLFCNVSPQVGEWWCPFNQDYLNEFEITARPIYEYDIAQLMEQLISYQYGLL